MNFLISVKLGGLRASVVSGYNSNKPNFYEETRHPCGNQ